MKERIKGAFTKKKIFHFLKMVLFVVAYVFFIFGITGFTSVEPFFGCVRVSHVQIEKNNINDCFQLVGIRYCA